jgi:nickel-type superoxide dismutase maturation protease
VVHGGLRPAPTGTRTIRAAGPCEVVRLALGRRRRFVVRGDSMAPALPDGSEVLVDPAAYGRGERGGRPRPGDVVVARHPYRQDAVLIKRVAGEDGEGRVRLVGDNPTASTDSRVFGAVPAGLIVGRVTSRFR